MKHLIIIDGYSLFFRAYYATAYNGQFMHTSAGLPTNAIFAFANMIFRVLEEHQFTHILVALDPGGKTLRHEILAEYKGTRKEVPDEMRPQFDLLPELLDVLHIPYYKQEGIEADDIIGTIAKQAEKQDFFVDILSSDRDLLQLIDNQIVVRLLKKGLSEIVDMNLDALRDSLQLAPYQIPDLKGLMGDASDNIPGVPGIGEKTALKLLHQFDTLENLYNHIDDLKGKQKDKLIEYKEQAFLSKKLATIHIDIDVLLQVEALDYQGIDLRAAQQFFRKIESKTLAKRAQTVYDMQMSSTVHAQDAFFSGLLEDIPQQEIVLSNKTDVIDFQQETVLFFEHPFENYHKYKKPLYVCIYHLDGRYQLFEWMDFVENQSVLKWLLDVNAKKIVFDLKKIYAFFLEYKIEYVDAFCDVQIMSYVCNPGNKNNELADIAQAYAMDIPFREHIYGKNKKFSLENDQGIREYIIEEARTCATLYHELMRALDTDALQQLVFEVEQPLAKILVQMEYTGITVDKNILIEQGKVIVQRIEALEDKIYELAGKKFNISSPKQLGVILFEDLKLPVIKKTKTGYSTAVDVLEKLIDEHDIIRYIGEYRQLTKLYSTYIVGLQPTVMEDGKIHTIYNQTQTQTGRLSSIEPNLQNIPIRLAEGRLIRKAFIPSHPSGSLLAADYSQIELRVLASLANVPDLLQAFINKRDIHRETAAKIFNVTVDDVTDTMRSHAKAVNFGIIYGMSDFGLASQLNITRKEAKSFIDRYFELFPGIHEYMEQTVAFAQEHGYVETILGRRRYFPTIQSKNFNERNFAKRAAMNAPIQGSAADILKLAMLKIHELMKENKLQSQMILQVHDELIFDVFPGEEKQMEALVYDGMVHAHHLLVPLQTSVSLGENWYDAK